MIGCCTTSDEFQPIKFSCYRKKCEIGSWKDANYRKSYFVTKRFSTYSMYPISKTLYDCKLRFLIRNVVNCPVTTYDPRCLKDWPHEVFPKWTSQYVSKYIGGTKRELIEAQEQCDQIWRFFGLWATF